MTIAGSDEDTTDHTVVGLDSGTEYTFWVRAVSYDTRGQLDPDDESYEVVDAEDMIPATPVVSAVNATIDEDAEDDEGLVGLTWSDPTEEDYGVDGGITMWQYSYMQDDGDDVWVDTEDASTMMMTITDLMLGDEYTLKVRAVAGPATGAYAMDMATPLAPVPFIFNPSFEASSDDPGKGTRYDLRVQVLGDTMNTLTDELVIELEDYDVASSIGVNSIAINVDDPVDGVGSDDVDTGNLDPDRTTIPEDVSVSGEKIFITIGDLNKDRTGVGQGSEGEFADFDIDAGAVIHVVIRQSAGVNNPTENGDYGPVVKVESAATGAMLIEVDFSEEVEDSDPTEYMYPLLRENVPTVLDLDEEDGGLGTVVTATGKGFKNATTLTVFIDKLEDHDNDITTAMQRDNTLDLGEDVLCQEDVGSDDTASCEFTVTHPTFSGGVNYISAVDGRDNKASEYAEFTLEESIQASPAGGSPGEIMLVQVVDFPGNQGVSRILLGGLSYCGSAANPYGDIVACPAASTDPTGTTNFPVTVPNWARSGTQQLKVYIGGKNASTNVDIGGPQINVTPRHRAGEPAHQPGGYRVQLQCHHR